MPFIGQEPITGAFHKLDAITTSATATYNLQLNSSAYSPASANHLLVSLNGVIQSPGSSFTISGSQITFSSALTSSDSIDFIMAYGDVLNIGTPSDGTVNADKLVTNAVTDAKIVGMTATKLTGTVSNARFPAGTIVQVVSSTNLTSALTTTNSTPQETNHSVSITPQFSDSDIIIKLHTVGGQTTAGRSYKLRLNRTIAGGSDTNVSGFHLGDTSAGTHLTSISMLFTDTTVSSTDARVYRTLYGTDGVGTAYYNYQNAQSKSVLMAMEIKR
jgi:hypothetical protein